MAPVGLIWFALLVPLAIAGAMMLIAQRLGRRPGALSRAAPKWGSAAAIGVAFAIAHWRIVGAPTFVPEQAEHVAFWGALFGLIIVLTSAWVSPSARWSILGRFAAAFGIAWLVMRWKMTLGQWAVGELALWATLVALLIALAWGAMLRLSFEDSSEDSAGPSSISCLAALGMIVLLGAGLVGAQARLIGGTLMLLALGCAVVGDAAACAIGRWRQPEIVRGAAPVLALTLGPLMVDAVLRSPLEEGYAALVLAAPMMLLGARSMTTSIRRPLVRAFAWGACGLAPLLVVTAIEFVRFWKEGTW